MKVLWLTNTASLASQYVKENRMGGDWISSLDLKIQRFSEVDLNIIFLSNTKKGGKRIGKTMYYPIYQGSNKKFSILLKRFSYFSKRREKILIEKIRRKIIEINPDIIHIHGTENFFGLAVSEMRKPVFVSIQGNLTVSLRKFFSGIHPTDIFLSLRIKDIIVGNTYFNIWKKFRKNSELEKKVLRSIPNIIGRTDWDRRISLVFNPNRNYFYNGEILRPQFYRNEWNHPYVSGVLKIFTTNGPALFKGFETICETLILLKGKIDIEWKVAGLTDHSPNVRILKRKLKNKYPSSDLKLLGKLDENELIVELLNTHLYIMPSHIENSPNNLCEAQILGIPCIATNAGGTASLITDKVEGILIQDGDPWHMAGAVLETQSNYERAMQMAKKGRSEALIRHNPERIIEDLVNIYNSARSVV